MVFCSILSTLRSIGVNGDDDDNNAANVVVGPNGLEMAPPSPAPTLSPGVRRCQWECGDHYFTCAVMKCEELNFNETDTEENLTESFKSRKTEKEHNLSARIESRKTENEILQCWVHCREVFQECFDNCKHVCAGNNCDSSLNELKLPLPPVQDYSQFETTKANSGTNNIVKGNR